MVQFVIENGSPEDRRSIISKLQGQLLSMSRHKFASNVCEKALVKADPDQRRQLIDEIMTPKPDGVSPLVTMMKDQYASMSISPHTVPVFNISFARLRASTSSHCR